MTAFKNRSGFTLAEVLVAITIIGLVMTSVFVLQGNSFRSIKIWSQRFERVMAGILFMTQAGIEKEKDVTSLVDKKLATPATNMRYQMKEMPEESSLSRMKDLYLERVILTWHEGKKKKEETIVMVRYRPEVKKE